MANYSTQLEEFTERLWVDKKVSNTVMEGTAVGTKLMSRKSTGGGKYFEKAVRLDRVYTASEFAIGDTFTANTIENSDNLQANYRHIGDAMKIDLLTIAENDSAQGVISKMEDNVDTLTTSLEQKWNDNLHYGLNASNKWGGLDYMYLQTGSYYGVTRAKSKALIPFIVDATATGKSTAGTVTVTVDSATLTGSSTTFVSDNIVAGDQIIVTGADGLPYTFQIASVDSETQLTLATNFPNSAADGAGLSYTLVGHFNDTTHYGAAGDFTLEKADHAFTLASFDGKDPVDFGYCQSNIFERFRASLRERNRYSGESNDPGLARFSNFKFNNADIVIDPRCPSGRVRFLNTKYSRMQFLNGFDQFDLVKGPDGKRWQLDSRASGAAYVTMVAQSVISGNWMHWAHNRCSELKNLKA